jgi:SagB-type dehydrogenase family enzyme
MRSTSWNDLILPASKDQLWELYHENSKVEQHRKQPDPGSLTNVEMIKTLKQFYRALPYDGYPKIALPKQLDPLTASLGQTMSKRRSALAFAPTTLTFESVATLLHYSYGITRGNASADYPAQHRVVPSAGALYPLELYFYACRVHGLQPSLYHFNPIHNNLSRVCNSQVMLSHALAQPNIAYSASLLVFVTALFERTTIKYGERGYRFTLLEAGHVAQNISLVTSALGLSSVPIGGFLDRIVDDFIGIDGLTHSTIYMVAVGGRSPEAAVDSRDSNTGESYGT